MWEAMGKVVPLKTVRGKTEQRIAQVVRIMQKAAPGRLSYEQIREKTDTHYDVLIYIMQTLVEVGLVERTEEGKGPGRPKVYFAWIEDGRAQEVGS